MSVETNKETARRFIEEEWNHIQPRGALEFADLEHIHHDPTGQVRQGAAQRPRIAEMRAAAPDLHFTITRMVGEGDFVAVQWRANGTHQQPISNLTDTFAGPPTGKSVTLTGVFLFRFEGGKLAEYWAHWDRHHLLEQVSGA
jgi:predicted ester cyclase